MAGRVDRFPPSVNESKVPPPSPPPTVARLHETQNPSCDHTGKNAMTGAHLPSTKIRYPAGSGFCKNFCRPQCDMHRLESHVGGVAAPTLYSAYSIFEPRLESREGIVSRIHTLHCCFLAALQHVKSDYARRTDAGVARSLAGERNDGLDNYLAVLRFTLRARRYIEKKI